MRRLYGTYSERGFLDAVTEWLAPKSNYGNLRQAVADLGSCGEPEESSLETKQTWIIEFLRQTVAEIP